MKQVRPWGNPNGLFLSFAAVHDMRNDQRAAYRTGRAFAAHKFSAHNGDFDPNCPACRELKTKTEVAGGPTT